MKCQSMARCSSQAFGPLTRMASESKSCSTVSAPTMSGEPSVELGGGLTPWRSSCAPVQVEVAPGAVLGAVAEPCRRRRRAAPWPPAWSGVGEHGVVEQLGGEAQVAVVDVALRLGDDGVDAADALDVAASPRSTGGCCHRWAGLPSNQPR